MILVRTKELVVARHRNFVLDRGLFVVAYYRIRALDKELWLPDRRLMSWTADMCQREDLCPGQRIGGCQGENLLLPDSELVVQTKHSGCQTKDLWPRQRLVAARQRIGSPGQSFWLPDRGF